MRTRWPLTLTALLICLTVMWMGYTLSRPLSSHVLTGIGTGSAGLVITAGRSAAAFYAFLLAVSLVPAAFVASRLLEAAAHVPHPSVGVRGNPSMGALGRRIHVLFLVVAVCTSAMLAGYALATLRTQLRLSAKGVEYRSAGQAGRLDWQDVRAIVLRWRVRSQTIELVGSREALRMDLSMFAEADRVMLVRSLPRLAHLDPTPQRGPAEWVWRRYAPAIAPPETP